MAKQSNSPAQPTSEPKQLFTGEADTQRVAPFVDGALSESLDAATVEVRNPSTGRLLMLIPAGCELDVDCAVTSARRAFESGQWNDAPPSFRKKCLHRLAELIAAQARELDALDAGEMGKPISEAFANAAASAALMHFCAEAVDKVMGDVYASDSLSFAAQRRVARGVVAAIAPWNFPTYVAVLKVAPALAGGNCVVLKPSEFSSRSAIRLAQLALDAGLPKGVLNVVPGLGRTVGQALGLHGDVDMVTFTGSTNVGKLMLQYSGKSNMKAVLAECGGKSPQIVFPDAADLDMVAGAIARSILTNQGQVCSVGSRILVERSIEEKLIEKVTNRFSSIVMGDAMEPRTTYGPMSSSTQYARVMGYIEKAKAEGAELVVGGCRALPESGGTFIEPTVFCGVAPSSTIAQEEVFGPVLSVIPFDDEAEAIHIANGTKYGLTAFVWTTDLSRGMRMMKGIRSSVRVTAGRSMGEGPGFAASQEPFGQSGLGVEGGLAGVESYLRRQRVWFIHA